MNKVLFCCILFAGLQARAGNTSTGSSISEHSAQSAALSAQVTSPVRNIFGTAICSEVHTTYYLKSGGSGCPHFITPEYQSGNLNLPEMALHLEGAGGDNGALGGENYGASYMHRDEADCKESGLRCIGRATVAGEINVDWNDQCNFMQIEYKKSYSHGTGFLQSETLRETSMRCLYAR